MGAAGSKPIECGNPAPFSLSELASASAGSVAD